MLVKLKSLFWRKVIVRGLDDCWEWSASLFGGGYGCFNTAKAYGMPIYAHRFAYAITKGALEDSMYICHSCDNPKCCNPIRLFQATPRENALDMCSKGKGRKGVRWSKNKFATGGA